ncbi:MAG: DUF4093 domain-containing protein, partial [Clostridia bacterium]|nr:DUF4093 domain-containing protein [Clostridia bacterium]
ISQCFGKTNIKHAYIPEIEGKEKRKSSPSKDGILGVEGIKKDLLVKAVTAVTNPAVTDNRQKITKTDLYELSLSGKKNSSELRKELLRKLNLPQRMSVNEMLAALNILYSKNELEELLKSL